MEKPRALQGRISAPSQISARFGESNTDLEAEVPKSGGNLESVFAVNELGFQEA
jgi:hypothetical protein